MSGKRHKRGGKVAKRHPAAFNLKRLRRPARPDDLRVCLIPDINPATQRMRKGFETLREAKAEKARRARSLERYAKKLREQGKQRDARRAASLAKLIRRTRRAKDLPSFANPLFMREFRRRLLGEILRVLKNAPVEDVRIYTIASPKWRRPSSQLAVLDSFALRESLRTSLTKAGLDRLSGWVIVCFHNERDVPTDTDQPHFHVIVVGEKYRAFEALRNLDMFQRSAQVFRPIVGQPLDSPARQISYLVKGYWVQTTGRLNPETNLICRHDPRRLSEPRHAEFILFLNRLRFADLVWLHGIKIKGGRLVPDAPR